MLDVKDVLSKLTDENIVDIMIELGFNYPISSSHSNEKIYNSLCHEDGEHKNKLYCYHNENGYRFNCYICGFNGNIIDLIMHIKQCQFEEAFKLLKKVCNITYIAQDKTSFGELPLLSDDYWKLLKSYRTRRKQTPTLKVFCDKVLGLFTKEYHISWLKDFITTEAMSKFGIGYYYPQNAITIPHRDINGNLIGIRKRNLDKTLVDLGYKYMPMTIQKVEYTHPLMFNLYGLNENKEIIKKIKKVCIFEAEKSVLQVESYYPNNNWSLAMCGSSFSQYQKELILSLGIEEVIICVDKDWETTFDFKYKLFKKKYMTIAQKLAPFVNVYVVEKGMSESLGLKESPSDRGKETFEKLLKQKKLITLDMVQQYFEKKEIENV